MNIDSGPEESVAAYFQDFVIKPPWALLVWVVQMLLVGIEWSYALNLLHGEAMSGVVADLQRLGRTFTQPLLALALAVGAALLAWRGIVRRDVAASFAEALTIAVMVLAGLVMILDPLGTIGSLANLADRVSAQTLAAVAGSSPAKPDRALAEGMTQLFATTIGGPWCFMEFGNVAWCEEPSQLDPTLHTAALELAAKDEAEARQSSGEHAQTLADSATLLRSARTNGAIFLAQPANGPARNSSKESGSLLHVLCDASNDNNCKGQTASEAEFRTSGYTIDRAVGLLLILAGALGMLLLLGFVLSRLLGAAVLSLLFLLLAPVAVLAPALGESGRAAFRGWLRRLLAAVLAKLLWSFVLGILLLVTETLLALGGFGWWLQWLLMSVLWWGAFHYRNRLLGLGGDCRLEGTSGRARRVGGVLRRSRYAMETVPRRWQRFEERRDYDRALKRTTEPRPYESERLPQLSRSLRDRSRDTETAFAGSPVAANVPMGTTIDETAEAARRERAAARKELERRRAADSATLRHAAAVASGRKVWKDPEADQHERSGPS